MRTQTASVVAIKLRPLGLRNPRLLHLQRVGLPLPADPPPHLDPCPAERPPASGDGVHVLRVHRGPQVDDEGEDVEGEDGGDDPLEDGGLVVHLLAGADGEGDAEGELDDDEEEL